MAAYTPAGAFAPFRGSQSTRRGVEWALPPPAPYSITTLERLNECSESICHLFESGEIKRHNQVVGHFEDIEIIETALETEAQSQDEQDTYYLLGQGAAYTRMLGVILDRLGYQSPEAKKAAWVLEREAAIAKLRTLCAEYGDNDWPENLHLADIIEKHLAAHLPQMPNS